MQIVFKQILKQSAKITRILTKLSEAYPKMSQDIDLALYAAIKIEKIVNKYIDSIPSRDLMQMSPITDHHSATLESIDPVIESALQNIQSFKNSTFKLERKINVLISQSDSLPQKGERKRKIIQKQILYGKEKKKQKISSNKDIDNCQESSVNLSQLDASILKLTKEIKKVMRKEQQQSSYQPSKEIKAIQRQKYSLEED